MSHKARYDVAMIDNSITTPGCTNETTGFYNGTRCNDFKAARCADLKKVKPNLTTFVYRSGPFGCLPLDVGSESRLDPAYLWFDSIDNQTRRLNETWLTDRGGVTIPGQCDLRKEAAQNFWLTQHVFGPADR